MRKISGFLLLCLNASPLWAASYIVDVGGSQLAFKPALIAIDTGDTITFINKGGKHNVVADDGSFRCALGCDGDGKGGNGNSNSSSWLFTLTFANAGTFGYFCETHGAPGTGMFGTIIVNTPTPVRLQSFEVD